MPAITVTQLRTAEIEANMLFLRGLQSVSNQLYERISTPVRMSTKTVETPIAGMIGPLREWTGPRQVEALARDAYSITAKKFEKTVGIPRDAFEDDNLGTWMPQLETFGMQVKAWPDQQVAAKLELGETDTCFDGKAFFATDHPVEHGNSAAGTYSNMSGTGHPAWYLFDLSKGIKPLIWALRTDPEFVQMWSPDDDNVFWRDEFISGVRARGVADYGFPHLAYKCKGTLDASNYEAAKQAMKAYVNGKGENLGVHPTLLVVPSTLEGDARRLIERIFETGSGGNGSQNNVYYKDIEWVVWQRLSNGNQT